MALFSMPDVLVLAAGVTFILAYLIINQVVLRIIVLFGTGLYIWYYAVAADAPLWAAIWTSIGMGAANVFGLAALFAYKSRFMIPAEGREIYDRHDAFSNLPPGDFRALFQAARKAEFTEETKITTEGVRSNEFYYLISGSAKVNKLGRCFELPGELFVGEVAYLLDQVSSATVEVSPGSKALVWENAFVRGLSAKKPRFRLALEAVLCRDLSKKVAQAVSPESEVTPQQLMTSS